MLAVLLAETIPVLPIAIGGGALLFILFLFVVLRRRPTRSDAGIHGENMADYPPPPPVGRCQLYFLNEPVRVRLVILAPLGRQGLPENPEAHLEKSLRGLGRVLAQDKPAWRTWPAQLSAKGFMPQFLRFVHLPTKEHQPTPWQLVCGQIKLGGQMVAIGLVLLADEAIHRELRQVEPHQWGEQLRVELMA